MRQEGTGEPTWLKRRYTRVYLPIPSATREGGGFQYLSIPSTFIYIDVSTDPSMVPNRYPIIR